MEFNPEEFTAPTTQPTEPKLPTAAAPIEGGKAAMPRLMAKLQAGGWPAEAAAGIVGNWMGEGAGHPAQWEKSGGGGFGHAQWTGPRRKALAQFATEKGKPADDEDLQIEFFNHEMDTKFPALKAKLQKGDITYQQAAKLIESQYEAPGKPTTGARIKYAKEAMGAAGSVFGQGDNLYDMESAQKAGLQPDETGHWGSRVPTGPDEGLLLKHEKHPTFWMTMKGELDEGNTVYKAPNGRLYSFPEGKEPPEGYKVFSKPKAKEFNPADFTAGPAFDPKDFKPATPAVDPLASLDLGFGMTERKDLPEFGAPEAPGYIAPMAPTKPLQADSMGFAEKWLTSAERQQATEKLIPNAMIERAEADYKGTPRWLRWGISQRWTPEEVKSWEGQYSIDRTFLLNTAEQKEQISRIASNLLPKMPSKDVLHSTQTMSAPTGTERPFAEHPSQKKVTNTQSMAEILTKDPIWSLWQGAAESIGKFAALQADKSPEMREFIQANVAYQLSPSALPPTADMYHSLWRMAFRSTPGLIELMALQAVMPVAGATWATRIGKEAAVFGLHSAMEPAGTGQHMLAGAASGAAFGGLGVLGKAAAETGTVLGELPGSRLGKVIGAGAIGYGGEWMFNPDATDESLKMATILTGLYGMMAGPERGKTPKLTGKALVEILEGWQKTLEEVKTVPKDVMKQVKLSAEEQVKASAARGGFTGPDKQFEGYFTAESAVPTEATMHGGKEPMISARENLDTGLNKPERREDLLAQQEQLKRGNRSVQMFSAGTGELPLPEGMERVETDRGVFHFDPKQTTAEKVRAASEAGRENELLGLGPYSKADIIKRVQQGESPSVLVERGPNGEELRSSLVVPSTLEETRDAMDKGKSLGSIIKSEQLDETLAKREPIAEPKLAAEEISRGKTQAEKSAEGAASSPFNSFERAGGPSDLSENERATGRLLEDFKSRGVEEYPKWTELFRGANHSVEFERSPVFQDISSYLKAAGIDNVIPAKDMKVEGASYTDKDGKSWVFLDEDTGLNSPRKIADHELVHWADENGLSPSILRLRSMIDINSTAFKDYKAVVTEKYQEAGLSKPNNETIKAELLADYLSGTRRAAGLLGKPVNVEGAFLNADRARELGGKYREEISARQKEDALGGKEPMASILGRIKEARDARGRGSPGLYRERVNKALGGLKEASRKAWSWWTKLPEQTDFKTALGDYLGEGRQITGYETYLKIKTINDAVPGRARQEAITNWLEAGGDADVLRYRAEKIKNPSLKKGYEAALNLTPDELAVANGVRKYFNEMLNEAQKYGLLGEGIENYVTHIWGEDSPITKSIVAESNAGMFDADFDYAKERSISTYFEGEQRGKVPKDKRIGYLVGKYHQAFGEAIAAKKFIHSMVSALAKDGNPLVAVTEGAVPIESPIEKGEPITKEGKYGSETTRPDLSIIRPRLTELEAARTGKYRPMSHTALKKWKWEVKDQAGKNVLKRGDLWVHEDIYTHLDNVLKRSALRKTPFGRGVMQLQQEFKSTLLTGALFHQVQLGEHATFHWMSPFNPPELDFSQPLQRLLVNKGLMVYDHNALAEFGEGLHATGLINRLPEIGPVFQGYGTWMFQDYIPKLKMALAQIVYHRNMKRYSRPDGGGLLQKMLGRKPGTPEQMAELSAAQANAAFGELNYKWMGRNPTRQDVFRLLALAPDFLEARLRFAGQAFSPYGKEQAYALARGALMMYGASTVLNTLFSDEKKPHWDKPFTFVYGGKEYTMRSIPGDIIHAIKDPRGFAVWRMSPTTARTFTEFATGRDMAGRKRSAGEQVQDFITAHVPIPLQSEANKLLGISKRELTVLEAVGQMLGAVTYKHFTDAEKVALQYHSDHRVDLPPEEQKLSREHKKVVNLVKDEKVDEAWDRVAKLVEQGKLSDKAAARWVNDAGKSDFGRLPLDKMAEALTVAQPNEQLEILGLMERKNLKNTDAVRLKKTLPFLEKFVNKADSQILEMYDEVISDVFGAIADAD